jgi:hypothetical protein
MMGTENAQMTGDPSYYEDEPSTNTSKLNLRSEWPNTISKEFKLGVERGGRSQHGNNHPKIKFVLILSHVKPTEMIKKDPLRASRTLISR